MLLLGTQRMPGHEWARPCSARSLASPIKVEPNGKIHGNTAAHDLGEKGAKYNVRCQNLHALEDSHFIDIARYKEADVARNNVLQGRKGCGSLQVCLTFRWNSRLRGEFLG
jgi:hypothetical protein